jgi:hypothetical protein
MIEDCLFATTKLYHDKIFREATKLVKLLHIEKLAHMNIDKDSNVLIGCSDIKWAENSTAKQYYKINRGINVQKRINFQFVCDVNPDNCPDSQKEMLHDAQYNYNWHNNFAFHFNNNIDGSHSCICFGSSKENQDIYSKVFKNLTKVKMLVVELIYGLNKLYNLSMQKNRVHISKLKNNDPEEIADDHNDKSEKARHFLNQCSAGEGDFLANCWISDLEKSFFHQAILEANSGSFEYLKQDQRFMHDLQVKFSCNNEKELILVAKKLHLLCKI